MIPGRLNIRPRSRPRAVAMLGSALLALAATTPLSVAAATVRVPAQFATLAAALSAAGPGDQIVLAPGVHPAVDVVCKVGVTIRGDGPSAEDTVLDAGGLGRILLIEGLADSTVVMNLTLRNGNASGKTSHEKSGGAALVTHSTAVFADCAFVGNTAEAHGGALRAASANLIIRNCDFSTNRAIQGGGGAVEAGFGGSLVIIGSRLSGNLARWGGAVSVRTEGTGAIITSFLVDNEAAGDLGYGGAIFADKGAVVGLVRTVLSGNVARFGGGAACFAESQVNLDRVTITDNAGLVLGGGLVVVNASPFITASIIAFNEGAAISLAGQSAPSIVCSNLFGNTRGDWDPDLAARTNMSLNYAVDPQFCSRDPWDYEGMHLAQGSYLLEALGACLVPGAFSRPCGATTTDERPPQAMPLAVAASPNPFNPRTEIRFQLGATERVLVQVHGPRGELVQTLVDEVRSAGQQVVVWTGRDTAGRSVASGTYLVLVQVGLQRETLKVSLLK